MSEFKSSDQFYEVNAEHITRNSAKCLDCGTEIESKHRHDFVACKCDNIFVDGGKEYRRFGYKNSNWEDTSIFKKVVRIYTKPDFTFVEERDA